MDRLVIMILLLRVLISVRGDEEEEEGVRGLLGFETE